MNCGGQIKMERLAKQIFLGVSLCVLAVCGGCAHWRSNVEKNLMDKFSGPEEALWVANAYRIGCPDLIEVSVQNRPELYFRAHVEADGRIYVPFLEPSGIRISGLTRSQVALRIAHLAEIPYEDVVVNVAEYNSQYLYLIGQVNNSTRSLPYKGPESVLGLLQRAGGISPGAEPDKVFVVRSQLAQSKRPEVFRVDLRAIVLNKDYKTNIRLLPFDQVHVGETRQAKVERCIPPWLRPVYQAIWDTRPHDKPLTGRLRKKLSKARRILAERKAGI